MACIRETATANRDAWLVVDGRTGDALPDLGLPLLDLLATLPCACVLLMADAHVGGPFPRWHLN